jgi:hypothetical protein
MTELFLGVELPASRTQNYMFLMTNKPDLASVVVSLSFSFLNSDVPYDWRPWFTEVEGTQSISKPAKVRFIFATAYHAHFNKRLRLLGSEYHNPMLQQQYIETLLQGASFQLCELFNSMAEMEDILPFLLSQTNLTAFHQPRSFTCSSFLIRDCKPDGVTVVCPAHIYPPPFVLGCDIHTTRNQ